MNKLARLEVACGVAWFFDDGCWLMGWRWPCYAACVVAVGCALVIPWLVARRPVPLLVCGADSAWLAFNVLWSVGDLDEVAWCMVAAKFMFFVGAGFFAAACCFSDPAGGAFARVLGRLRFFRGVE
jgi:hypothetical protein